MFFFYTRALLQFVIISISYIIAICQVGEFLLISQICWKLHICSSWGFTNFAIWQIWNATILKQSVNSSSGYREKIASKFGYIDEFGYIDNTQHVYWRMKTCFKRNWLELLLCDRYHLRAIALQYISPKLVFCIGGYNFAYRPRKYARA